MAPAQQEQEQGMSAAGPAPTAMPDGETPASPQDDAPFEAEPADDPGERYSYPDDPSPEDSSPDRSDPDYSDSLDEQDEPYDEEWDYEQQPVSKLAVASLVSGLLALLPLALGFGIAALVTIRRTGRRGYRMAVTGIYAAWIWVLVAAAVVILAHFTHGFRSRVEVHYQPAAAYSLRPGNCLNGDPNGGSFTVVSCSSAHQAEVYGRFSLAGRTYPGTAAVHDRVAHGCASLLTAYVNPQLASISFNQVYVYPDHQAWSAGERTVICTVQFTSGAMSGSIRKAS